MADTMAQGTYTIEVIVDDSDAKKGLTDLDRAFHSFTVSNQKDASNLSNYIKGNNQGRVRDEKKAYKEATDALKKEYQARLEMAKGNARDMGRIHAEELKKAEALEKEHASRVKAIRSTSVTGRAANRFTDAKEAAGGGAIAGNIAGIGAAVGPIGAALTGVVGVVGALASKAIEARNEFENLGIRVKTMLNPEQAAKLPATMEQLRAVAISTGVPMKQLGDTLYNVIGAVPSLANNLAAAGQIVEKVAKTSLGLGASSDSVALAMTNLGNAMGLSLEKAENQNLILDTLANTMNVGVIPSGEELAANIAKAAPAMAALSDNAKANVQALGAMNAVMTGSGVSVAETQTQIAALSRELLNAETAAKLGKAGIEGFDAATGKVSDWTKLFQSLGSDVNKFASIMGSSEAQNAVRILGKAGGDEFRKMMESMQAAGGMANQMFQTMSETSEAASARLAATWNDALITIGGALSPIWGSIKGAAADALGFIVDLFKSSEVQAAEATAEMQNMAAVSATVGTAMKGLAVDGPMSMEQIAAGAAMARDSLGAISEIAPFMANEIRAILDSPEGQTVEGLQKIHKIMGEVRELADAKALAASMEAGENAADALNDKLSDLAGNMAGVAGAFTTGLGGTSLTLAENTVDARKAELEELQKIIDAETDRAAKAELIAEKIELQNELAEAMGTKAQIQSGLNDEIVRQMEQIRLIEGEKFDIDKAREQILGTMVEATNADAVMQEEIARLLQTQVDITNDAIAAKQREEQINASIETILREVNAIEGATNEDRIKALQAKQMQNEAELRTIDALIRQRNETALAAAADLKRLGIALAIAEANGSATDAIRAAAAQAAQAGIALAGMTSKQNAAAKERVSLLKAENVEIDKRIKGMGPGSKLAAESGGKAGKSEAQKAAEKEEKAAKKAAKEAAKDEEKARKDQAEQMKKELDRQAKESADRRKLEEQGRKAAEEQRKAIEAMTKAIQESVRKIQSSLLETAGQMGDDTAAALDRFKTAAEKAAEAVTAKYKADQAALEVQKKTIAQAETDLIQAQGSLADSKLLNQSLTAMRERLNKLNTQADEQRRLQEKANSDQAARDELVMLGDRTQQQYGKGSLDAKEALDAYAKFNEAAGKTANSFTIFGELVTDVNKLFGGNAGLKEELLSLIRMAQETDGGLDNLVMRLKEMEAQGGAGAQFAIGAISKFNRSTLGQVGLGKASEGAGLDFQVNLKDLEAEIDSVNGYLEKNQDEIFATEQRIRSLKAEVSQLLLGDLGMEAQKAAAGVDRLAGAANYAFDQLTDINKTYEDALTADTAIEAGKQFQLVADKVAILNTELAGMGIEGVKNVDDLLTKLTDGTADVTAGIDQATGGLGDLITRLKESKTIQTDKDAQELRDSFAELSAVWKASADNAKRLTKDVTDLSRVTRMSNKDLEEAKQKRLDLLNLRAERRMMDDDWIQYLKDAEQGYADIIARHEQLNREMGNITQFDAQRKDALKAHEDALEDINRALIAGNVTQEESKRLIAEENKLYQQQGEVIEDNQKKANKAAVAAQLGNIASYMGQVDQMTQSVLSVVTAAAEGGRALQDAALGAGQAAADMAGKITGLPMGEVFGAMRGFAEDLAGWIEKIQLENSDYYKDLLKQTEEYEKQLGILEMHLQILEIMGKVESARQSVLVKFSDEAEERLVAARQQLQQLGATLQAGGIDVGTGEGLQGAVQAIGAYNTALREQADLQDKVNTITANLESEDLSDSKRQEFEARLKNWQAQLDVANANVTAMEDYLAVLSQVAAEERNVYTDKIADLQHQMTMGTLDQANGLLLVQRQQRALLRVAKQQYEQGLITKQELQAIEVAWKNSADALQTYNREQRAALGAEAQAEIDKYGSKFERVMARLAHEEAMGEWADDPMGLLQARLDAATKYEQQLKDLFDQGLISEQELWAIEEQRYQLQQDMLDLQREQGLLTDEEAKKLRELNKERQALILQARNGDITAADRLRIKALEDQIIADMTAAGATPEAIAAAQESFAMASYDKGTPFVPEDMVAKIHKGERIMSATENKQLIASVNASNARLDAMVGMFMAAIQQRDTIRASLGGGTGTIFAPVVNINGGGSDARATAAMTVREIEKLFNQFQQRQGTANGR